MKCQNNRGQKQRRFIEAEWYLQRPMAFGKLMDYVYVCTKYASIKIREERCFLGYYVILVQN